MFGWWCRDQEYCGQLQYCSKDTNEPATPAIYMSLIILPKAICKWACRSGLKLHWNGTFCVMVPNSAFHGVWKMREWTSGSGIGPPNDACRKTCENDMVMSWARVQYVICAWVPLPFVSILSASMCYYSFVWQQSCCMKYNNSSKQTWYALRVGIPICQGSWGTNTTTHWGPSTLQCPVESTCLASHFSETAGKRLFWWLYWLSAFHWGACHIRQRDCQWCCVPTWCLVSPAWWMMWRTTQGRLDWGLANEHLSSLMWSVTKLCTMKRSLKSLWKVTY